MGRWLEIVEVAGSPAGRKNLPAGVAPSALLSAAEALPHVARGDFLILSRIADPLNYTDESMWLGPREVRALRREFERMRRITTRREFLSGVDGAAVLNYWRGHDDPASFERYLDQLSGLLASAEDAGAWLHFNW